MEFYSLLFETAEKAVGVKAAPAFFTDLNLDQITAAVIDELEDGSVAGYYYTPVKDVETVRYRQDVMCAIEGEGMLRAVTEFLYGQQHAVRALANSEAVHSPLQRDKWLIDAACAYCASIRAFIKALTDEAPKAAGFAALREYLEKYAASAGFTALEEETAGVQNAMSEIKYDLQFDAGRVLLEFVDGGEDLSRALQKVSAHMAEVSSDSPLTFFPSIELNSLEKEILAVIEKRFPELFERAAEVAERHRSFMDDIVRALPGELWFYIAYHKFIEKLRAGGMKLCYPDVSEEKSLYVSGAFDMALAAKYENPADVVVTNDFTLTEPEKVFILTGPNQGGKTTFARSYGQIMYLASLGLPVPAASAKLWLAQSIFTHFATEEDLSSHSGRLQEELLRLEKIYAEADGGSLLIFNELFATTTTYDAIRLGKRVLEWIGSLGALCLYVSHITDLADAVPGLVSLTAEVVSPDNPERTYKIRRRAADGEAYATSIARRFSLTYADIMKRKAGKA